METCECKLYKDAAEKCQFFTLGTLNPLIPRIPVPQDSCIIWKCNNANHEDFRPNKPLLISKKQEIIEKKDTPESLEPKWIPVLPGVISQKFVNESKPLNSIF